MQKVGLTKSYLLPLSGKTFAAELATPLDWCPFLSAKIENL